MSPKHIAIIMDGNGRWARARGHGRLWGHVRGARAAKKIIEACAVRNIQCLTLFAFSTENWQRPAKEISFLMKLLVRHLQRELKTLQKNNVRFSCLGDLSALPTEVRQILVETFEKTSSNTGLQLVFALNYGGRQEITQAVKDIVHEVVAGNLQENDIDEATIAGHMSSSSLPDPELIIRTSGETRLSNFFLWKAAYSEIFFCEKMWPDFSAKDLDSAIQFYGKKERRFGKTSEQLFVDSLN